MQVFVQNSDKGPLLSLDVFKLVVKKWNIKEVNCIEFGTTHTNYSTYRSEWKHFGTF